ncbi:MAG: hypothetical protein ACO38E_10040, partial [Ilumatobacteraceae bacterium]
MRRFPLLTISLATCAVTALAAPAPSANATGDITTRSVEYLDLNIDAKGSIGGVGIGYDAPAIDPYGGYSDSVTWRSDGSLMKVDHEVGPTYLKPKYDVDGLPVPSTSTTVRLEAYPRNTTNCSGYDWQDPCYWENYSVENSVYGGFHMDVVRNSHGSWPRLGTITLPTVNDRYGGFAPEGSIIASSDVTDGRVHVDAFQIDCWITEVCPSRPVSSAGIPYGAFSSGPSRGDTWFMSVGWPGRYTLYITDNVSGEKVQVLADIDADNVPTIDLDAPCFGFKECITIEGSGSPPAPAGQFHPLPPTRILDTRSGLGIPNGPVREGDGSIDTSNDDFRTDEELNHELVVTGRAGVPKHRVAALGPVPPHPGLGAELACIADGGEATEVHERGASGARVGQHQRPVGGVGLVPDICPMSLEEEAIAGFQGVEQLHRGADHRRAEAKLETETARRALAAVDGRARGGGLGCQQHAA